MNRKLLSMRPSHLLCAALLASPLCASSRCPSTEESAAPRTIPVQQGARSDAKAPEVLPEMSQSKDPAVVEMRKFIASKNISKQNPQWKTQLPMPPKLTFSEDMDYFWNLETNKGNIIIELMPKIAPMHVSSTMYLTDLGFYDNTKFHRVIKNFMAQGGDPLGNGSGGPGYKYDGEYNRNVTHSKPGMLSMANTGRPTTDGSQFFLTFVPTPHLNGRHTIFGQVVKGMDTVRTLERFGSGSGATTELLKITRATFSVLPKPKPASEEKPAQKPADKPEVK